VGASRHGKRVALLAVVVAWSVWGLTAGARGYGGMAARGGFSPMLTTTPSHSPTPSPTGGHHPTPTPNPTPGPLLYDFVPSSGPSEGGTDATVIGEYFQPGGYQALGGVFVHGVVTDPQHLELTVPPLWAGRLNYLLVVNGDGQIATLSDAFFADFVDVPHAAAFHDEVERLVRVKATTGCADGFFCPSAPATRAQVAVFLVKGDHGDYAPPACSSTVFTDVPCPGGLNVDWVNELYGYGVTVGCGAGNFCPLASVSRSQMAVLLLKRTHEPGWTPPPCASTIFTDVPCPGGAYVDWVNELAAESLTAGCGGGMFCPDAALTRGQMAALLVKAFYSP
jgi:hypothetical protein